eukprot:g3012.t1
MSGNRGRCRSSTSHTGGSLKIPIGFVDDDDPPDDDCLGIDIELEEDAEDSSVRKTSSKTNPSTPKRKGAGGMGSRNSASNVSSPGRVRLGTGAHFGIKEAKHNRDMERIKNDKKVAVSALRTTSTDDSAEESNFLDEQYENEVKENLSARSIGSEPRTPILQMFSGSSKNRFSDGGDGDAEALYNFHVKLLLLGDSNVGKSCVLTRYADDRFDNSLIPTTGVDFKTRFLTLDDGQKVKCQVWDTAGQERFRMITRAYYKGAHGIVLVYDVTDRKSFEHMEDWICAIQQYSDKGIQGCVFCNKMDIPEDAHVVTKEEGEKIAKALKNFTFYETSAKTGKNIQDALDRLTKQVIATGHVKALPPVYTIGSSPSSEKPRRHEKYRKKGDKKSMCRQQ